MASRKENATSTTDSPNIRHKTRCYQACVGEQKENKLSCQHSSNIFSINRDLFAKRALEKLI
jgi:hypothetical protein